MMQGFKFDMPDGLLVYLIHVPLNGTLIITVLNGNNFVILYIITNWDGSKEISNCFGMLLNSNTKRYKMHFNSIYIKWIPDL